MMELFSAGSLAEVDGCLRAIARRSDLATRLTQARDEILEAMRLETIEEAEKRLDAMRFGNMIDHDPNAHLGLPFAFIVGDDDAPIETWGSEANLFHNPKALHPVPLRLFESVTDSNYVDGFYSDRPNSDFIPIMSISNSIRGPGHRTAAERRRDSSTCTMVASTRPTESVLS
jgi:hypothetical protein